MLTAAVRRDALAQRNLGRRACDLSSLDAALTSLTSDPSQQHADWAGPGAPKEWMPDLVVLSAHDPTATQRLPEN
jgi:hypothetical protein